ncbi:ribosomal protection-like ABC-F family protein [Aquibacillus albus]|uniref:ATPase subunit of ABC transporter with duplicated ATPase domains n=1 Tax=Aquibacillus albus TaxID=1168171 RepID=A0ABS2MZV7_9BACI|nr:ABC-F family ATP-binding cassette domain-containing protein [Aquibacillus albus]MBM7571417.1 ATPase subunit of ABC transporter with duplicated ATPase domains [Aquibacillus albus]
MRFMHAQAINISIGDRVLLKADQLSIHQGHRIGLVGRNGQGKTLLIHSLLNKVSQPFMVEWQGTFAHFEQLNDQTQLPSYLSGGEKTMKKLAEVFASNADVLVLDEPTNNLDWTRISQLEAELLAHQGAMLIVSHDRALLDGLCTKIWELEEGNLEEFTGNYSYYEQQKALKREQQYLAYEQYLKEKNRLEARIKQKQDQAKGMRKPPARMSNSEWQLYKNKAAGKQKKVEQVSIRLQKRVEKLEKVDKPMEWDTVKMNQTHANPVHRKTVVMAKDIKKYIGNQLLFDVDYLKLKTGSKTAIIGDNGSGKTTLINELLSSIDTVNISKQAKIGRFEQALETLPVNETIYDYVKKGSEYPQHIIRIILGRLHFSGEDVNKSIGVLSGGERVKLALAKLLVGGYNFLILDEPTNHLDLEALQAVETLMKDYEGTILFVSHDRRFVENTANHLWILKDKTVEMFDGTLLEYSLASKQETQITDQIEEKIKLETRLTELIGRLSLNDPKEDKFALENAYQETLLALKKLKGQEP